MRGSLLVVALAGCDKLFGLAPVPDASFVDAAADADDDGVPDADPGFVLGCSDHTREGFADPPTYPGIAACAGAWSMPGLRGLEPACGRAAGNDGVKVTGSGCTVEDLCAPGWHVCQTKLDVAQSMPVALRSCAGLGAGANTFFATAQGGPGGDCSQADATDDFQGCGTYGLMAMANCLPLDRTPNNMCVAFGSIGGWNCPVYNSEVTTVTKTDPFAGGGVLCCRDVI